MQNGYVFRRVRNIQNFNLPVAQMRCGNTSITAVLTFTCQQENEVSALSHLSRQRSDGLTSLLDHGFNCNPCIPSALLPIAHLGYGKNRKRHELFVEAGNLWIAVIFVRFDTNGIRPDKPLAGLRPTWVRHAGVHI